MALADPAVKARMADLGSEPLFGSVSDFAKLIANETEKWARVVKFAGLNRLIPPRHTITSVSQIPGAKPRSTVLLDGASG